MRNQTPPRWESMYAARIDILEAEQRQLHADAIDLASVGEYKASRHCIERATAIVETLASMRARAEYRQGT